MVRERLRVFISGKEEELQKERAVAIKTIEDFCYDPLASENRPASDQPIETEYIGEVNEADIYVGIFCKTHSPPTRQEFDTARANDIPVLVFEKQLNDEPRDPELDAFLTGIKDPKTGITSDKYNNAVDFKKNLKEALSLLISRKFKKTKALEKKIKELEVQIGTGRTQVQPLQTKYKVPFVLEIRDITITGFELPDRIKKGEPTKVSASATGTSIRGFLDLFLVNVEGYNHWYPDPKSWDPVLDTGKLYLNNEPYSNTWEFALSDKIKTGKYGAYMGFFEDPAEPPVRNRRLIAIKEKEIELV